MEWYKQSRTGTLTSQLYYIFCRRIAFGVRNRENIVKLGELGDRFRFVGLSLTESGLKEYVKKQHFKFPVYTRVAAEAITSLGLGTTPQTIVISPEGRVLKNWTGAYSERTRSEVEEFFQTRLPGLTSN